MQKFGFANYRYSKTGFMIVKKLRSRGLCGCSLGNNNRILSIVMSLNPLSRSFFNFRGFAFHLELLNYIRI